MARPLVTLRSTQPGIAAWQVPATYIHGTIALHHPPIGTGGDVDADRYRLTHIPSGAKLWDCRSYQEGRRIARAIGGDPLFGGGVAVGLHESGTGTGVRGATPCDHGRA